MVQSGDRREIKRDGKNALRKGHSLNLNSLTIHIMAEKPLTEETLLQIKHLGSLKQPKVVMICKLINQFS